MAAGLGYGAAWDRASEQVTLAPGLIAWPQEVVFDANPVEPEGAFGILVRISGPETQPVVRLRGVGGPCEPVESWRQTDRITLCPGGPREWVVGFLAPGEPGVYPAEVTLGGLTFSSGDWLLRVYAAGFLAEPGFASPEEAGSARFARDFPRCTLRKIEPWALLSDDSRDPGYHRLLTVTFYQPYAGPVLPAGTHTYCYYLIQDGPAGPWRVLAGGTGP